MRLVTLNLRAASVHQERTPRWPPHRHRLPPRAPLPRGRLSPQRRKWHGAGPWLGGPGQKASRAGLAPVSQVEEDLKNQGVADVTSKVYRLRKATAPNGSLLPSGSLGASHWHRGKRLPLWATTGWLTGDRGSLERRVWRTRQAGQGPGTRH